MHSHLLTVLPAQSQGELSVPALLSNKVFILPMRFLKMKMRTDCFLSFLPIYLLLRLSWVLMVDTNREILRILMQACVGWTTAEK